MRNLRWWLAFLAAGAFFAPGWPDAPVVADEPAEKSSDLEHEVRRLLADLAGETRAQRMAAEKRVIELGPKILPLLPAPELLPTVSVREAVRRIRVELEQTQARESVLPSKVTLAGSKSLAETIAEITRQTDNRLDGGQLGERLLQEPVDLDFQDVRFWQALDDLAARLKVHYEFDTSLRGLKLLPPQRDVRPLETAACYVRAFRVTALPADRIRRAAPRRKDGNARPVDDLARVTLLLMPEPRLRPLFLQFAMRDATARTAERLELKAFNPEAAYELALAEGGGLSRIQLDYLIPATAAASALDVKGRLRCMTAAGHEIIRFTELEKALDARVGNVARRRGGVTVTLNRVRVERASAGRQKAHIQVTVAYDAGGPAFESHHRWLLHNEVFLEDRAGKRVNLNGGSETSGAGNGGAGIEYHFVDLPGTIADYTFVYVAPTLIVDVPIEFEIQSIPIGKK
ncbi:MAG: hypothetical protein ACM3U2_09350 [Deltaproteobacteria bacterium]